MLVADLRADTEMRANPEACPHQVPGDPVQALKRDMNVPLVRESAALSIVYSHLYIIIFSCIMYG